MSKLNIKEYISRKREIKKIIQSSIGAEKNPWVYHLYGFEEAYRCLTKPTNKK
jgi:hypothetical protein